MSNTGTDEKPIDLAYYDLLDIAPDAENVQIKKAYMKLARQWHPDKNPAPEAEAKFKEIAEAYKVLSDPQKRAYYNKYGKDKEKEGGIADPKEFYRQMFGGGEFQNIIGDLAMAELFAQAETSADQQSATSADTDKKSQVDREKMAAMKTQQKERIDGLAKHLIQKLDPFVSSSASDEEAQKTFQVQIAKEAERLKTESYGLELLHAIGYVYSNKAKQFLGVQGGEMPSFMIGFKQNYHSVKQLWSTVKSAMDVQAAAEMAERAEKLEPDERIKIEEDIQKKAYKAFWQTSKFDVETTLRQVCDRVLKDEAIPKNERRKRAKALRIVGQVYQVTLADSVCPLVNA